MKRLLFFGILLLILACNSSEKEKTNIPISNNSEKWLVLGDSAYRYGKNDSALYYYERYRSLIGKPSSEQQINAICKLGKLYLENGDYERADGCLSFNESNCNYTYNLGVVKYEKGDPYAAKDLFLSILNCDSLGIDIALLNLDIANNYAKMEDTTNAMFYFQEAIKRASDSTTKVKVISDFATFYSYTINNYDKAISYFQKIEHYPQKYLPSFYWFNYGDACNEKGLSNLAKRYTYKEYLIKRQKNDSLNMGITCNNLGFLFMDSNEFDSAMHYFSLARNYLTISYQNSDNTTFRSWEKIIRNSSGIAKTYMAKYANSKEIAHLDSSLSYFHKTPAYMHQMRKILGNEQSKSLLTTLLYKVYEPALQTICHQKSANYLQYACDFIEAGKSLALLEEIQDKVALSNGQIPKELLLKKDSIQIQMMLVDKEIQKKNTSDLYRKKVLLEQKHQELLAQLQKDYRNYYNLKYPNTAVNIKDIRDKCRKDNSVFIDFFQGRKSTYILYITGRNEGIIQKKITDSSLNIQTEVLRKSLDSMGNGDQKHKKQFKSISNQLYQSLFAELDSVFQSFSLSYPIKATLVLDGHLHKIPFDALLCDTLKKEYLIEKYNFSLAHSAAMYLQTVSDKGKSSEVLAISPVFDATFNQFYPGPHGSENPLDSTFKTLTYLEKLYAISPYLYEKANAKNFQKNAAHYGMIHLATHAVANDTIPKKSYIAFAPDSIGDAIHNGYFSLNEVYSTPLNASLALLTACETGKGQIKKGEGVMSLARAFRYAGCERIIMTLWSVDEGSTMEITKSFYDNLAKGESYGDALYKAKLQLKSQSPNKWAALVLIGDANGSFPLKKRSSWISIALLGLGGLILLGIGYFLYHRKRNL